MHYCTDNQYQVKQFRNKTKTVVSFTLFCRVCAVFEMKPTAVRNVVCCFMQILLVDFCPVDIALYCFWTFYILTPSLFVLCPTCCWCS